MPTIGDTIGGILQPSLVLCGNRNLFTQRTFELGVDFDEWEPKDGAVVSTEYDPSTLWGRNVVKVVATDTNDYCQGVVENDASIDGLRHVHTMWVKALDFDLPDAQIVINDGVLAFPTAIPLIKDQWTFINIQILWFLVHTNHNYAFQILPKLPAGESVGTLVFTQPRAYRIISFVQNLPDAPVSDWSFNPRRRVDFKRNRFGQSFSSQKGYAPSLKINHSYVNATALGEVMELHQHKGRVLVTPNADDAISWWGKVSGETDYGPVAGKAVGSEGETIINATEQIFGIPDSPLYIEEQFFGYASNSRYHQSS